MHLSKREFGTLKFSFPTQQPELLSMAVKIFRRPCFPVPYLPAQGRNQPLCRWGALPILGENCISARGFRRIQPVALTYQS